MVTLGHKDGSIEKMSLARISQVVKGFRTHTIIGGEFAIVPDDENIAFKTLLGSCVAIMFYDKNLKIKGMNHFLLPTTSNSNEDPICFPPAKILSPLVLAIREDSPVTKRLSICAFSEINIESAGINSWFLTRILSPTASFSKVVETSIPSFKTVMANGKYDL